MRALAVIPLLAAAGCGGGPAQNNMTEAAPPAALPGGQWDLTTEVTSFAKTDQGATPRIDTPVGTRGTETICLIGADRPPAQMFTGPGYRCDYGSYYVSGGRISVTANCQREGLTGNVVFSIDGRFGADRLDYNRNVRTLLSGDGDVLLNVRVTGRRSGFCAPATGSGEE